MNFAKTISLLGGPLSSFSVCPFWAKVLNALRAGQCSLEPDFVFNDPLNNFERIAAHCSNIAITIFESQDSHMKEHDYVGSLDRNDHNTYELQLQFYKNKYPDVIAKA